LSEETTGYCFNGLAKDFSWIIDTTKKIIYAPVSKRNYEGNNEELDKG